MEDMAENLDEAQKQFENGLNDAKARLENAESQARDLIREYPLAALGVALLVGYVAARILPRI